MRAPREWQENEPFQKISVFYDSQYKYKSPWEWDIQHSRYYQLSDSQELGGFLVLLLMISSVLPLIRDTVHIFI